MSNYDQISLLLMHVTALKKCQTHLQHKNEKVENLVNFLTHVHTLSSDGTVRCCHNAVSFLKNIKKDASFHIPHWPVSGFISKVLLVPLLISQCLTLMAQRNDGFNIKLLIFETGEFHDSSWVISHWLHKWLGTVRRYQDQAWHGSMMHSYGPQLVSIDFSP